MESSGQLNRLRHKATAVIPARLMKGRFRSEEGEKIERVKKKKNKESKKGSKRVKKQNRDRKGEE